MSGTWKRRTATDWEDSVGVLNHTHDEIAAHNHDDAYVNEVDHTTATHNSLAIDHGSLSGAADDDHPHYLNEARHDVTARHPAGTVLPTAVPGTASFGDTAAEGTSGSVARADHVHGMPVHDKAAHDALNIDADTLDGVDSTGFATSTHNHDGVYEPVHNHPYASDTHNHDSAYANVTGDTITGTFTIQDAVLSLDNTTTTEPPWDLNQDTNGSFVLTQAGTGGSELQLDSDGASHTTASLFIGGSRALTTADEGSGNGLDADTVDGSHASAFAVSGHNHDADYVNEGDHTKAAHDSLLIDADTVDGNHASAFATSGHGHSSIEAYSRSMSLLLGGM